MDPNSSNQPVGMNPVQQPVATAGESPKKGMGKGIVLLVILLLLVLGMAAYILFANNQLNNQKITAGSNSSVLPSPTAVPTLTPENDLEISSPEADLLEIEAGVNSL